MSEPEDIFRSLFDESYASLHRFFMSRGLAVEDSHDLAQETFLRAYRSLNSGTVRKPGRSWLFVIASNVWSNHLRSRSTEKRRGKEVDLGQLAQEPAYAAPGAEPVDPPSEASELIYQRSTSPVELETFQSDLLVLDDELIRYLKSRPEKMRELSPRKFEELVASLLEDLGYGVELTACGADGGVDIFATQKSELGESLVIVDCKRYSLERRVGVGIVRALYGLSESFRATKALLATTSFFTRPARAFEAQVPYRMGLRDYDNLVDWLMEHETRGE